MKRETLQLLLALAVPLFATGCASSSKTYGPNGEVAYSLNCSGTVRSWGMCLEKAGDLCGTRGYNVVSSSGDVGSIATGSVSGQQASFVGGSTITRQW